MDTVPLNLPQMNSIWIDEDEEAEKLYSLQVQQLMDSDDEDKLGVVMINSDKPILNNKTNIELPPLPPSAYKKNENSFPQFTKKKKKSILKFFKTNGTNKDQSQVKISAPFGFNHISHADSRSIFDSLDSSSNHKSFSGGSNRSSVTDPQRLSSCSQSPFDAEENLHLRGKKTLSKAFVTDALSHDESPKSLRSRSPSTCRSSTISTSTNSYTRVVSASSMATSLVADSSLRSLAKLNNLEKIHLKHKYNKSEDSAISVEFLKSYQFPTVLEDSTLLEFKSPHPETEACDKFAWDPPENSSALLESMLYVEQLSPSKMVDMSPLHRCKSESLITPLLQQSDSFFDTPKMRRSVDDVLLCYHQVGETCSTATHMSSDFSFTRSPIITNTHEFI